MTRTNSELSPSEKPELKERICEILEVNPNEVTETSRFKEDHDADSMLSIEILAMIERDYGVEIPQSELSRMLNLEGIYSVVNDARSRL